MKRIILILAVLALAPVALAAQGAGTDIRAADREVPAAEVTRADFATAHEGIQAIRAEIPTLLAAAQVPGEEIEQIVGRLDYIIHREIAFVFGEDQPVERRAQSDLRGSHRVADTAPTAVDESHVDVMVEYKNAMDLRLDSLAVPAETQSRLRQLFETWLALQMKIASAGR